MQVQVENSPNWYKMLHQAITEPGELRQASQYFRKYSLANRWLASMQLRALGMALQPINTFKGWLEANRPVMKGQKAAISLIMPVPIRKKKDEEPGDSGKETVFTKFMLRRHWFFLSQTEGEEYVPKEGEGNEWSLESALAELKIEEVPFQYESVCDMRSITLNGRQFAVSDLSAAPQVQRLVAMAHITLDHTAESPRKSVPTEVSARDAEAHAAAYLVAATLGIPGIEHLAGQVQAVLKDDSVLPQVAMAKAANRAFSAADKILNAGYC